jgi:hypothetical protein
MKVGEITVKLEDSLAPKNTALVEENPLPMMLTVAPPPAETVEGLSDVTRGPLEAGATVKVPRVEVPRVEVVAVVVRVAASGTWPNASEATAVRDASTTISPARTHRETRRTRSRRPCR